MSVKGTVRVGFLFNHYAVHQVSHAIPYAFELSRRHPEIDVVIACSSRAEMRTAERIATLYPGHCCSFRLLHPPRGYHLVDPLISKWSFLRKEMILIKNLAFFRSLDALVAPERHCMQLRERYGLKNLILIHTRHGAGDRAGGFDDRSGAFDLTLLPGQKYVDRLTDLKVLKKDRYAVPGWPKFEVVRGLQTRPDSQRQRFFDNDNPVIVYAPHFSGALSSWQKMGTKVLDFFADNPQYNLIFAPHVVLFRRSMRHRAQLPNKYFSLPNLYLDKGSDRSADMTYLLAADIYMGDVSSQVYEFLLEPRPCIFLNSGGIEWEGDPSYLYWTLGQVVSDIETELKPALESAQDRQPLYRPKQEEAFAYTFHSEGGSTAAERGARAIYEFIVKRGVLSEDYLTPATESQGAAPSQRIRRV